jgi:hypothetical protein
MLGLSIFMITISDTTLRILQLDQIMQAIPDEGNGCNQCVGLAAW